MYEGRVEVKYNDLLGTVCKDMFDDNDAKVICRHLQYMGGSAVTDGKFGPGTGDIWLDNLGCDGTELTLDTCQANNIGIHNCGHSDDAGVICTAPAQTAQAQAQSQSQAQAQAATLVRAPAVVQPNLCSGSTDPQIRLVGPNDTTGVGFVEVQFNSAWGAVCDDHWNIHAARVVCGALCFTKNLSLTGTTHDIDYVKANVSQTFLLDDVKCTGSEANLFACQHRGIGVHNCHSGEYASVTCTAIKHTVEKPPEPDLNCTNEQFTVSFSRTYDPGLVYSAVTVETALDSTSACNPKYSNTTAHITMEIPFNECDTEISSNATHIFYNITLSYIVNNADVITRKNHYYVGLMCEFPRNKTNDAGFTASPQQVTKSSRGEFEVSMLLYADDNFNFPLTENPTLELNQPLSASLHLLTSSLDLKIVVRTCFATPSGSWTDSMNYILFQNNCAKDDTVAIIPWNETTSGFRFNSFKFLGHTDIYLHCSSLVCEMDAKDQLCDRSCSGTIERRRRRRSSRTKRSNEYLYTTSKLLTIHDAKEGPVIERYPTTAKSTSRTIPLTTTPVHLTKTPAPTSAAPTSQNATNKAASPDATTGAPSFSTSQPSGSSVKVYPATRPTTSTTIHRRTTPVPTLAAPTSKNVTRKAATPDATTVAPSFSTSQPGRSSVKVYPAVVTEPITPLTKSQLESNDMHEICEEKETFVFVEDTSSASHVKTSLATVVMMALLSRVGFKHYD